MKHLPSNDEQGQHNTCWAAGVAGHTKCWASVSSNPCRKVMMASQCWEATTFTQDKIIQASSGKRQAVEPIVYYFDALCTAAAQVLCGLGKHLDLPQPAFRNVAAHMHTAFLLAVDTHTAETQLL